MGDFVGEIAYHLDEQGMCQANVIVFASCRGQGYGREGLRLLCQAVWEYGVDVLYDDMAADNPAMGLFLSEGFQLVEERALTRLLKKDLTM
jgi:diamine N-acetyltransferase